MDLPRGELTSAAIKETMLDDLARRVGAVELAGSSVGVVLLSANPDHLPSKHYVELKVRAAERLGIAARAIQEQSADDLNFWVNTYNLDAATQGIVIQLPLKDNEKVGTDALVDRILPVKDVDGLRPDGLSPFQPATPKAIVTLLKGHGVELDKQRVAVLGKGRLVGAPLIRLLENSGALEVRGIDINVDELTRVEAVNEASVVISAIGRPNIVAPELFTDLSRPRVLVDAGTAEQAGVVHGDVSDELRAEALKNGWGITPLKGGVGPLTVLCLLENTVQAAERGF